MERVLLKLTLIAVISVHLVSITQGSPVDSAKKTEVEDFLNTGLREPEAQRRSDDEEPLSVGSSNKLTGSEPKGKPEKISVTIFKEYKIQQPSGEYVSIHEQDGDFKGRLNPPLVQSFIEQETGGFGSESSPAEVRVEAPTSLPIIPFDDQVTYQTQPIPSVSYFNKAEEQFQGVPQYSEENLANTQIQKIPGMTFGSPDSEFQVVPAFYQSQDQIQKIPSIQAETKPTPGAYTLASTENKYTTPRRKSMDGWIPLYGERSLVRGTVSDFYGKHLSKSISISSPHKTGKNQNGLDVAGSDNVPQVVPFIQVAAAQMMNHQQHASASNHLQTILQQSQTQFPQVQRFIPQQQLIPIVQPKLQIFTQNEVVPQQGIIQQVLQNVAPQGGSSQVDQLFINNQNAVNQGQKSTSYQGLVPNNVVIHAQNVIIGSQNDTKNLPISQANVRQIQAYDNTPQITAQLREQFLLSKTASHPLQGKPFPPGGLPLRSLAQALRNGAFSLDNDIVPLSEGRNEKDMQIAIPHTFRIKNPSIGGQTSGNAGGLLTSASIDQPISHGQNFGAGGGRGYGSPPKLPLHSKGQSDYGDSVKYQTPGELGVKDHVDIVDTQPIGAGGYGSNDQVHLSQEAQDLKQRLVQMVMKELRAQYGVPSQVPGNPIGEYGPPQNFGKRPSESYGPPPGHAPSNQYGPQQSNEYGPPVGDDGSSGEHGAPSSEYGVPSGNHGKPIGIEIESHEGYHSHHLSPPSIPTTIELDFDIGAGSPKGHPSSGGYSGYGDEEVTVVDAHGQPEGPGAKETLAKFGKNLFWAAIDFSRKYNPITFYDKVKEFPPVRFEVYDTDHHGKGHGGKGKKRRSQKN